MNKKTIKKWIRVSAHHPIWATKYFIERKGGKRMDDEPYLCFLYEFTFDKPLNLDNPKTFNEKMQWLKLYNRKPIYTTMVDKYAVKKYVADIIGEEYVIPTIGIYDNIDEINFDELPNQFVMKCTHDSGGLVIVRDKSELDVDKARNTINSSLKNNYYYFGREWPYKDVPPRILIEKYMEESKPICVNGGAVQLI